MKTGVTQCEYQGVKVYELVCGEMTVDVAPDDGMNICGIRYAGHTIVTVDPKRRASGGTWGMPVLYPTPNRISAGAAHFNGETLPMIWQGKPLLMHGAARYMSFRVEQAEAQENCAVIRGFVDFVPGSDAYTYFPFHSRLTLEVRVYETRLEVTHTVENLDQKPLAFGLAYHPFFLKIGDTRFRTGARSYYITDENKLPSGELAPAEGIYDLSKPVSTEQVHLDHVYTQLPEGENSADIYYPDIHLHLALKATPDFSHLVVFTPAGMPYFCLENQTCSTDCHNLYQHCDQTGLQIVDPGKHSCGTVTLEMDPMK